MLLVKKNNEKTNGDIFVTKPPKIFSSLKKLETLAKSWFSTLRELAPVVNWSNESKNSNKLIIKKEIKKFFSNFSSFKKYAKDIM